MTTVGETPLLLLEPLLLLLALAAAADEFPAKLEKNDPPRLMLLLLVLLLLLLLLLLEVMAFALEAGPENDDEMLLFPKVLLLIWLVDVAAGGCATGVLVLVLFRACDLRNGEF